eukprot:m.233781 g.233781  ORF g.233781 m.233781 type:complete len:373 (+) comp19302_c0_seq1:162-1280(+)
MATDRYAFSAEWLDSIASLVRKYTLCFFPEDNSVQMIDNKTSRMFLRRTVVPNTLNEFFLGNSVNICGRQLKIVDYADNKTRKELGSKLERTLLMIKPDCVDIAGSIIDAIGERMKIVSVRMARLNREEAKEFYVEHTGREFYDGLCDFMSSGNVVALEIVGDNAISQARDLIGTTDPAQARAHNKDSIRARFGTDSRHNAVHGSDSTAAAARELDFFFGSRARGRTCYSRASDSTICLIKPHIFMREDGSAGKILQKISEGGYKITGMRTRSLDKASAAEFLEVYKGVVSEYTGMVDELTTGPVLAIEVSGNNALESFRPYCGPADPVIAKHLFPDSLRAQFGSNKVQNAVHCTDLQEDSPLELQYFFEIL